MSVPTGAVGRPIPRLGDRRLLTGGGRYADDIDPGDALHIAFVRSPIAHGQLRSVDTSVARGMPRVRCVLDADGVRSLGLGEVPVVQILPGQRNRSNPLLAAGKVRYVGQPIVAIVADDPYSAADAVDAVELKIDQLPAVTDAARAIEDGSPLLYEEWETNVVAETRIGAGCDDAVFQDADLVLRRRFKIHRHAGLPLEGRAAFAQHDAVAGKTTAWISTQSPHHVKSAIAQICGWDEYTLRLAACETGGAFGTKEYPLAEEVLTCALARHLGRPVKWIQDCREHFLSTVHAREQIWDVELAGSRDGTISGLRGRVVCDVGAHCSANAIGPALQAAAMVPGPYRLAQYQMDVVGVLTSKTPTGAYRGYGVPEAAFVMERLVDEFARELDTNPVEVRRTNLIGKADQPYQSASGMPYDGGDYKRAFERAAAVIAAKRAANGGPGAGGPRVGFGLATFVMPTGLAPSRILGQEGASLAAFSTVRLTMQPDGRIVVFAGVCSQGQGTETMLAQIVADRLGLNPLRDVTVVLGDTEMTPYDPAGSISSRITGVVGGAAHQAADKLRSKLIALAAHQLEAHEGDIDLVDGKAVVRGSQQATVTVSDLARAAHLGHDLPDGMEPALEMSATHEPENTMFSFGTHAAVVEVDEETGSVSIRDYVAVHDSGTIVNPLLAEGQVRGAIAQGIGGALLEHIVYGDNGEPLVVTLMDYLMPTASEIPSVQVMFEQSPAPHIPGGMKGVGEPGIVGPAAAIANAVADALASSVTELPLSPTRLHALARSCEAVEPRVS